MSDANRPELKAAPLPKKRKRAKRAKIYVAGFRQHEYASPLPIDVAREIVRPFIDKSLDPKTLAKQHGISHVTFEKALAIERAVQQVHNEYRIDAAVHRRFNSASTISNYVAEVNAYHREILRFMVDISDRLTEWIESGPPLNADGKAALMQALYMCAEECNLLAQKLDGR